MITRRARAINTHIQVVEVQLRAEDLHTAKASTSNTCFAAVPAHFVSLPASIPSERHLRDRGLARYQLNSHLSGSYSAGAQAVATAKRSHHDIARARPNNFVARIPQP